MVLKTVGYPVSGIIFLFSLSTTLLAQTATKVLTPLGYRDSANVHYIPQGYELIRMSDGHMRAQNTVTGAHIDFAEGPASQAREPFTDNGWITYASWLNQTGKPVSSFTTKWNVPPAPTTYDGQTIFMFNSVEPGTYDSILQPVLQYGPSAAGGGGYWTIASWYVTSSNAYFTTLATVSPGTALTGVIKLTSQSGGSFSYSSTFKNLPATLLKITNISQLVWCTETLEVYGVDLCSEFPNTAFTKFSRINLHTGSTTPAVNWTATDAATSCGVQTTIVTNSGAGGAVDIYY